MRFNIPWPSNTYILTQDLILPLNDRTAYVYYRIYDLLKLHYKTREEILQKAIAQGETLTIPAGTVFRLAPFVARKYEKPTMEKHYWLRSIASPNPALGMKRYKGTSNGGVNFTLTKQEFESMEVEEYEEVTV